MSDSPPNAEHGGHDHHGDPSDPGHPRPVGQIECCPQLEPCKVCDTLDFRYRLPFRPNVAVGGERRPVPVEVTLHFRLTRCSGPLAQGDLLYTTTLLPGEQVRLFTSDRHSRFSFDSESRLSHRQETTSEESFFMAGMSRSMSDLSILDTSKATASSHQNADSSSSFSLSLIPPGGGTASSSSHDANSTSTLARNLSQHAQSSASHVEVGTRAAASTSVGTVASRTHTEGESEDHFESASRTFKNPNRCHALTFLFYRIDKCQTVCLELVGIDRRVDDPAAPTGVELNPAPAPTGVPVIPQAVVATSAKRLEIERMARTSALERTAFEASGQELVNGTRGVLLRAAVAPAPIPVAVRQAALEQVDKELVAEGLLDKVGGEVSAAAKKRHGWCKELSIPTPGVLVRGCLDECDICEDSIDREIELDLERKALENELLKKQIELLEKSSEYRCCPAGSAEPATEPA